MKEFVKGVIAALEFTDSPELSEYVGLPESECDKIDRIASAFYNAHKDAIALYAEKHGLNTHRVGNLVWYAWQGHGVGFMDYGECELGYLLEEQSQQLPYIHTYLSDCGKWLMCDIAE